MERWDAQAWGRPWRARPAMHVTRVEALDCGIVAPHERKSPANQDVSGESGLRGQRSRIPQSLCRWLRACRLMK